MHSLETGRAGDGEEEKRRLGDGTTYGHGASHGYGTSCGFGKSRKDMKRLEKAEMRKRDRFVGRRLLLMGSKKYHARKLPARVARKIDEAIACKMKIIVGEVPGACRLYQEYLKSKNYTDVVVGHAKSMRYNVGNWKTKQYGNSVTEREHSMIRACSSAIIIWTDNSGVIAENLELLKRLGKPTFLYEYYTKRRVAKAGWLDSERIYDPYYFWKERMRKRGGKEKRRRGENEKRRRGEMEKRTR